jgi:RNA polymerase sigma-70 factor (ECF subfamily)
MPHRMTAELPDGAPDDALMSRIAAGDQDAFTELFRRRRNEVYRVALLMTGSAAVAEDIAQDVFLAVMRDAGRYEAGRSTVTAWLCGIARNHARRRLDQDGRIVRLADGDELWHREPAGHRDLVAEIAAAEHVEALRRAILKLPVRYREVVVLCDLQELSYADAAAALDCAVGTVRSRLHRARALLTAKMRDASGRRSMIKGCLA